MEKISENEDSTLEIKINSSYSEHPTIEAPALNRLRTANRVQALRWFILVCALVFACSQSIASSHIHVGSHSDTVCALCTHTDNAPTLNEGEFTKALFSGDCRIFSAITDQWIQLAPPSAYLTRAPPQT